MKLIATHNSATGERSRRWWHALTVPFARCQTKTVAEQVMAGATYLDIRVRRDGRGILHAAHGLWMSDKELLPILAEAAFAAALRRRKVWLQVTYEGTLGSEEAKDAFFDEVMRVASTANNAWLRLASINVKRGWECLWAAHGAPGIEKHFDQIAVGWKSWRWLLPVPWLWKRLGHYTKVMFDRKIYKMVDFL